MRAKHTSSKDLANFTSLNLDSYHCINLKKNNLQKEENIGTFHFNLVTFFLPVHSFINMLDSSQGQVFF